MLSIPRAPRTPDELWWLIVALFGIRIPRRKVCPDHVSPFDALAHAYFAESPNFAVWYGSRGSGKSLALAILGLVKAFVTETDVTILGGSMTQSLNVRQHMRDIMERPNAPRHVLNKDTATLIQTWSGAQIKPLPASQTTVRGPHPPLQLLDEVDEMDYDLYQAALGQAMEQTSKREGSTESVAEYIVASSTWQNPEGCQVEGTLVTTRAFGQLPIERVPVDSEVLTRYGWRRVLRRVACGRRPTVTVRLASGRSLTCSADHEIWTESGWVVAGSLAPAALVSALVPPVSLGVLSPHFGRTGVDAPAAAPPPVRQLTNGLGLCEVMAMNADSLPLMMETSSLVVDSDSHRLEMAGVHAGAVATQVVEVQFGRYRTDEFLPDPAVCQQDALVVASVGLVAIAGFADEQRPDDAVVGVKSQNVVAETNDFVSYVDRVVEVVHSSILAPMWDLTVDGDHEYVANGILVHNTFSKVVEDAREKGKPVFTWCWRELVQSEHPELDGTWMTQRFIDNKRNTVSAQMWHTEYELNEPTAASRAFDLDKVAEYFVDYGAPLPSRSFQKTDHGLWVWEEPQAGGLYAVGADWAKEQDKTVITVERYDITPHRVVKARVVNRHPWDVMISWFNEDMKNYHAVGQHDKTGMGSVIHDFIDDEDSTGGFVFVGRKRTQMLLDYITEFEHGRYRMPKELEGFYRAHRATTVADVYAPGKWDSHLPDEVASCSLVNRAIKQMPAPIPEMPSVARSSQPRKMDMQFHVKPDAAVSDDAEMTVRAVDEPAEYQLMV